MRFTGSPFEKIMQEKPNYPPSPPLQEPPKDSRCWQCSYWQGKVCDATCYLDLDLHKGQSKSGPV